MSVSIRSLPCAFALVLACVTGTAQASVIYDQPSSGAACDSSCWTSTYANAEGGYQAFDNFTLGAAAAITTVAWTGFYYDYVDSAANPVTPQTQTWSLNFYEDDGGLPGSPVYASDLSTASVFTTLVGDPGSSDFEGDAVTVYSFSADLATPFQAAAGVTYWFSPLSEQAMFNPFFSWSPAASAVDGVTAQAALPGGSPYSRPGDRAFTLSGDATSGVPEPAAWSVMLLGVACAGGALRRDRRAVRSRGPASAMS